MSISTKQLKAFWKVTNLLRWKEHGDRKFVEVYLTLKFSRQEIGDFKDIGSTLASALVQRLNFWAATQWPPQKRR